VLYPLVQVSASDFDVKSSELLLLNLLAYLTRLYGQSETQDILHEIGIHGYGSNSFAHAINRVTLTTCCCQDL